MIHMRQFNAFEELNVSFLVSKQVEFATVQVTETGLKKSIMDATAPVRAYLLEKGIHDYGEQPQGPENKRLIETYILSETESYKTYTSLYRPVTKKGDPRMWVYKIGKFLKPDDIIVIIAFEKNIYVLNISKIDIRKVSCSPIESPLRDLLFSIHETTTSVSNELLGMIRNKMSDWMPSELFADTGIGRTVETLLGIPMNDSKQPDYKGIELKSKREKAKVRSSLFTQSPDWTMSHLKSGREIVEKYGYIPSGYNHKALHVTLSTVKPNSQGMGLNVNLERNFLEANEYEKTDNGKGVFKKLNDISVWQLMTLHNRLLTKHRETFWIDVDSTVNNNQEFFRVTTIEHTKNPIPAQFDTLLEQGKITVDFLLCRNTGGDTYSFKINRKDRHFLFPESTTYVINN